LAPVLFGLLARAGFDVVHPHEVRSRPGHRAGAANPKAHYQRLHTVDRVPVSRLLTAGDLLCTWLPALGDHLQRLDQLRRLFPAGMRPQGLLWGVVDDIIVNQGTTNVTYSYGPRDDRHHVTAEFPIAVRVAGRSPTGPFWLIAALGAPGDDRSAPFQVLDGYAHPAYSRSLLLPVDSGAERATATVLLDQLVWWQRHCGLHVRLHKPWATITLPDGSVAPPPDFLLTADDHVTVAVETMGAPDDPDYLARKAHTHQLMRRIPDVIDIVEHDPTELGNVTRLRRRLNTTFLAGRERQGS
jgi:hypothetical protein